MRRSLHLLTSLATLAAGACASAPSELEVLSAKHVAWRGGAAFESLATIERTGVIEVSGLSGPISSVSTADGRTRTDYDLGVVGETTCLAAHDAWATNTSGQVEDLGLADAADAERALAFELGAPFLRRGPAGDVELLASEEQDGRTWAVVRASYGGGDVYDHFLDPADGALGWLRIVSGQRTSWVRLDDWRMVDGVRIPFVEQRIHDEPSMGSRTVWERVTLGAPVAAQRFERPSAGPRMISFADGATSTGWMPFDLFRERCTYLPATVNGVETWAILDSGAGMSVLDTGFAAEAGIAGRGSFAASGTGGVEKVQFAQGVDVAIGSLRLDDATVALIDFSELSVLMGRPLTLIVGKEVFNETVVDVDYPNRRIAFHASAGWTYDGTGERLELREQGDLRVVDVGIEGDEPISVDFDLGNGGSLALFKAYVERAGLLADGRLHSTSLNGGVGGLREDDEVTLASVRLGSTSFARVPATLSRAEEGAFASDRSQGNVGLGLLARFRVTTHYAADALYLEPGPDLHREFDRNRAGLAAVPAEGALSIEHVAAGSPAAAAGFAVGERIVAIDGQVIGSDPGDELLWKWASRPAGTRVALTMADGSVRTIELRDYY